MKRPYISSTPAWASLSNSGLVPPNRSGWPESGVVFTPSAETPAFFSDPSKVGSTPNTPIDPVIVVGSAKMRSPAVATQ